MILDDLVLGLILVAAAEHVHAFAEFAAAEYSIDFGEFSRADLFAPPASVVAAQLAIDAADLTFDDELVLREKNDEEHAFEAYVASGRFA